MNKKQLVELISKGHYLMAADILQDEALKQTPVGGVLPFSPEVFLPWATKPQEHFLVACLNFRQQLKRIVVAHIGTLDNTPVHPRDVFRPAILENSGFIAVAHNHPSGLRSPSQTDVHLTKRLVEAGNALRIPVIDHYIVTTAGLLSMRLDFPEIFEVDDTSKA